MTADAQVMRVIAIDGPAGTGKSTVAKALAAQLGLDYLDTGAMYRAITFAALSRGVDPDDVERVADIAETAEHRRSTTTACTSTAVDATVEIRGPEVTRAVSDRGRQPRGARRAAGRSQREWARKRGGGVIEGRDIGTVVFPDAELKVYLTAAADVRAASPGQGGHRPRLRHGRGRSSPRATRSTRAASPQPADGRRRRDRHRHERCDDRRDRRRIWCSCL